MVQKINETIAKYGYSFSAGIYFAGIITFSWILVLASLLIAGYTLYVKSLFADD